MHSLRSGFLLSLFSAALLMTSCGVNPGPGMWQGGGGTATPTGNLHLAVADWINFRILLYNAPFSTNESASLVLGQPDLKQRGSSAQASAHTFAPVGLTMDAIGNLYVVDSYDCRVLEFQPPFTTDMNASVVIGQSQFTGNVKDLCAEGNPNGLLGPAFVAIDPQGDLWVSDDQAARITEYVPPFTNGMAATVSIGRNDFSDTYGCGAYFQRYRPTSATARTLCAPEGIAFDSKGDLWVADWEDLRVLEFIPPFSTGMAASLELGQPASAAFTSASSQGPSATSFCNPIALAFDSKGDLWVSDSVCDRVLEFVPPFVNGMAASLVLGQPDFTHGATDPPLSDPPPTATSLDRPASLSFDPDDNLFLSDAMHSRVLIFTPPFHDGMSATMAFGQGNMTSGGEYPCPLTDANTLCQPIGVLSF